MATIVTNTSPIQTTPPVERRVSLAAIQSHLPLPANARWPDGVWDIEALSHGSMSVLLFAPRGTDYQSRHEQDELYIILSGSGTLLVDGQGCSFCPGDVLFIPARVDHHFENFSDDLVTWAVFWGPDGGES